MIIALFPYERLRLSILTTDVVGQRLNLFYPEVFVLKLFIINVSHIFL